MDTNKKLNQQMEINDLIADAVTNAVTRRDLVGLSEQEAAGIMGGLTSDIAATELKEICPPTIVGLIALPDDKPIIDPTTKPPIKGICPPIVVGLIALPDDSQLA